MSWIFFDPDEWEPVSYHQSYGTFAGIPIGASGSGQRRRAPDEPPPDVIDAIRKVVDWARGVERKQLEAQEQWRKMQKELQSLPASKDWRDSL